MGKALEELKEDTKGRLEAVDQKQGGPREAAGKSTHLGGGALAEQHSETRTRDWWKHVCVGRQGGTGSINCELRKVCICLMKILAG